MRRRLRVWFKPEGWDELAEAVDALVVAARVTLAFAVATLIFVILNAILDLT